VAMVFIDTPGSELVLAAGVSHFFFKLGISPIPLQEKRGPVHVSVQQSNACHRPSLGLDFLSSTASVHQKHRHHSLQSMLVISLVFIACLRSMSLRGFSNYYHH
jgi:hypothetical protein